MLPGCKIQLPYFGCTKILTRLGLYLISMWYKRAESQKRFSFFYNASSLAAAFSGLLASAIGNMEGVAGYSAWRWIFILEGIGTCIISISTFYLVADFPEDAAWLTGEERAFIIKRLAADQGESGLSKSLTWLDIKHTLGDPKMTVGVLMYFGPLMSAYGRQKQCQLTIVRSLIASSRRTCLFHSVDC